MFSIFVVSVIISFFIMTIIFYLWYYFYLYFFLGVLFSLTIVYGKKLCMMLTLWISRGCSRITIGDLVGTASWSSLILTIRRVFVVPSAVLGIFRQSFVMLHLCHSDKSYAVLSRMYSFQGQMSL